MLRYSRNLVVLALTACAIGRTPQAAQSPAELLAVAVNRMGGRAVLERAGAFSWRGDAVVHVNGQTIAITGNWAVQPPDTAIVSTFLKSAPPSTSRALIVAAPRGWMERNGTLTPMPAAMLANERDEFYLYDVIRLVHLRQPGVALSAIPPDTAGNLGFRAERAGRPTAELYVDRSGRLAHVRIPVADPGSGERAVEDAWLEGTVDAGVRWPAHLRLDLRGQLYFELTVREFRVTAPLHDPRLGGAAR